MKQETTIDDVGGGMLVVEAPSVEDALAAVAEQIGPEGTIISAEKVSRGGVGGFFAKEIYRVSFQTTPQDHVPLETVADAPAPLIDVRSVVDRTAALAAAEDSVLDLRDGIDNSTAAVDRVLEWEEAPLEAAVPAPAPAPAASSSTPATFGEALRAQLEARGAAPQAPTASAAAPVVDAAPAPSATVATPTVPTASPTPTVRQHQAAETYAAAAPQAPVVRSETAVAAQPTSAETTLVVDAETEPQSRPGRTSLGHAPDGVVPGTGSVQWNADALSRLGLPFSLIQPLADLDTNDDLGWVYRLSELLAPLCGGLPASSTLLVGRRMDVLAEAMGLEVLEPTAQITGDRVAIETDLTRSSLPFLDNARSGRGLHVFCGAPIESTPNDVVLISFHEDHLGAALHLALATGARLGYCVRGRDLVHVTPFELALSVRSRLQRV